jgi:hypothetical protein
VDRLVMVESTEEYFTEERIESTAAYGSASGGSRWSSKVPLLSVMRSASVRSLPDPASDDNPVMMYLPVQYSVTRIGYYHTDLEEGQICNSTFT